MDVRNCKMCGHLFNYTNSPLCPQCNKKLEERFQDVKEYIRENPGAGMATVAEDTGVPVQQLKNGFVRSVWPLPRVPESR